MRTSEASNPTDSSTTLSSSTPPPHPHQRQRQHHDLVVPSLSIRDPKPTYRSWGFPPETTRCKWNWVHLPAKYLPIRHPMHWLGHGRHPMVHLVHQFWAACFEKRNKSTKVDQPIWWNEDKHLSWWFFQRPSNYTKSTLNILLHLFNPRGPTDFIFQVIVRKRWYRNCPRMVTIIHYDPHIQK